MGEVYRARDTRLSRDVALKILPEPFAEDDQRLQRFRREAQLLAALNHPGIAALYGLEDWAHGRALVLELVEGPTLADRIEKGPLPIDEALPLARQIAEALEAAHGQGIIHRDLKPANVKLRPDGTVKVLDFGLAKATEEAPSAAADTSQSATTSRPMMTGAEALLGTPAYMSPEQAKGRAADKRSDVWAFGCVLYEMLTARCPFRGDDVADTLAFVLTKQLDWSSLPRDTPPAIRRLLRRCLEKDRARRLADMADARLEIDEAMAAPSAADSMRPRETWSAGRRALPWGVAAMLGVALIAVLARPSPRAVTPSAKPLRMSIELGGEAPLSPLPQLSLSPDGNVIVYTGQKPEGSLLYVRRLDQLAASPLQGTDRADAPFFSPDGQWIAFFADGKLKKVPTTGGGVVTLADAPLARGARWAEDDTIVMAPNFATGLYRVPAAGGRQDALTTLDPGEATQRWPQLLPGGKALLYTSNTATSGFDAATLVVRRLPDGPRNVVVERAYSGQYLPSGHLVFVREATLFAAPFDLGRLEVSGPTVPVIQGLTTSSLSGSAGFAASNSGTLLYLPGQDIAPSGPILWLERSGKTTPLRATAWLSANLDFSPDGRRLALDVYDGRKWDIWIYDWARDTPTRLTFEASNLRPVWTPDGRRITFSSDRADPLAQNLYWQRSDGTGDVQRLTESKSSQEPGSWHPSGKLLAFTQGGQQTGRDLWILPLEGDEASGWRPGRPYVFLASASEELGPSFSPDGRWLAYHSNESGRFETYVRPFPGPGGKYMVSTAGGTYPAWGPHRQELFYLANDLRLMVSAYATKGGAFSADSPRPWSEARLQIPSNVTYRFRRAALHPDGQRFAYLGRPQGAGTRDGHVTLVFNFFDELRRLAPPPPR